MPLEIWHKKNKTKIKIKEGIEQKVTDDDVYGIDL
jgi:hypothetical protein